jgi:hypothetical protein
MNTLKCVIVLLAFFCLSLVGCDSQLVEPVSGGDQSLSKKGGVPGDGNGNKYVEYFEWTETFDCSGETLTLNAAYWGQFKLFGPPNNRNVELGVFHVVWTFTNEDGETFIWRDVGPDHTYVVGDELFIAITGRSTASGNIDRTDINVGHVVLNLTTNEVVFVAGRGLGSVYDLACDVLK